MKEYPILFNGPMVRAILDGSKTQTRRIVKTSHATATKFLGHDDAGALLFDANYRCPFGEIGDRLWVRETWQHGNHPIGPYESDCDVFYRADYLDDPLGPDLEHSKDGIRRQWRPSIHMPRTAARLLLEVIGVRAERLQDISEADAEAEGIEGGHATVQFRGLWDSVAPKGADWDANPWVWVVEFHRGGGEA